MVAADDDRVMTNCSAENIATPLKLMPGINLLDIVTTQYIYAPTTLYMNTTIFINHILDLNWVTYRSNKVHYSMCLQNT